METWLSGSCPTGRQGGPRAGKQRPGAAAWSSGKAGGRLPPVGAGREPHIQGRVDRLLVPSPECLPACLPTFTVTAATCPKHQSKWRRGNAGEAPVSGRSRLHGAGPREAAALGSGSEACVYHSEPVPVSTVGWHLAPGSRGPAWGTKRHDAWRSASGQEVTAPRPPSPVLSPLPAAYGPSPASPRAPGEFFSPNSH